MSASDTASRVLRWALSPSRTPPRGDLRAVEQLTAPNPELPRVLGELAAVTAARLRLGNPPLGDEEPPGLDGAVLAAALGAAELVPEYARHLTASLEATRSPWEWVIRHGLAGPALPYLPPELADECRLASPLTALLERPAGTRDAAALNAAERLRRHPAGRRTLQLVLAEPSRQPAVRRWRTRLLDRLRLQSEDGKAFVLDVYEAAMIHHEREAMAQAQAARAVFLDPRAAADEARLEDALTVADGWGPLGALARSDLDALRARRYLGYAYREGLGLFRYAQRLRNR